MDILQANIGNDFLDYIKARVTDEDLTIFANSFYNYLKYDGEKDFVISLDEVWGWIGFSRKDNCKRLLEKNFTIDIDYIIIKAAPPAGGAAQAAENLGGAGHNQETILMNTKIFKKLCLKANTKKSDTIHDY